MAFRTRTMFAACLLAGTAAVPAFAADDPPSATAAATTAIAEQAAYEKARIDRVVQRIDALDLKTGTTGKTELKENAGSFEGWLLSARAIDAAAAKIAGAIKATPLLNGKTLVLLAGDEPFDLSLNASMRDRLQSLESAAAASRTLAGCDKAPPKKPADGAGEEKALFPVAALPAIGALIGAIRTDTEVHAVDGPSDHRLIVNALADHAPDNETGPMWMVPGDYTSIDWEAKGAEAPKTDVRGGWNTLLKTRDKIVACRVRVSTGADAAVAKDRVAVLDGWLASFATFEQSQVTPGNGPSPLIQAIRLEGIAAKAPMVVRVYLEKSGGSVLVRRNLLTVLGAAAVGVTGGAVVGWRAVDPATGAIRGGGNLSCRTNLTGLRRVHEGRFGASDCDWIETRR